MFYGSAMPRPTPRKRARRVSKAFRLSASVERDLRAFAQRFTKNDPAERAWTQTDVVERALTMAMAQWRQGATPWGAAFPATALATAGEATTP